MAKQVQFRRGTTSQHSSFTGAVGEITVDTDKDVAVIHDGSTAGGFPLVRQLSNLSITSTATELNLLDGVTATTTELNYVDVTTLGTSEASKAVTADANGDVNLAEELKAKSYNETYAAVTSSSNATTVNCENGNAFSHTLTENTTFTFSGEPSSGTAFSFSIEIIQDASASGYTVTWPTEVDWPSATAPTLTATASAKDVFVFYTRDGGTNWYGFTAGQALG